jgi:hypothetical protein
MLRSLQAEFRAGVLAPDAADPETLGGAGVVGADRFWIHRNNYVASLEGVLADTYRAVARFVGEENFRFVAHRFVRSAPPDAPSLYAYGGGLPDFIAGIQAAVDELPFLPDLARLEWAVNEAYFAADAEPLLAETLAGLAPEDYAGLRLTLHPTARLVASDYPVWHIWDAEDLDAIEPEDLPEGGDHVLVLRPADKVDAILVSPGDHAFLAALDAGAILGDAVGAALAVEPDFDLTTALAAHLERGTFIGFERG